MSRILHVYVTEMSLHESLGTDKNNSHPSLESGAQQGERSEPVFTATGVFGFTARGACIPPYILLKDNSSSKEHFSLGNEFRRERKFASPDVQWHQCMLRANATGHMTSEQLDDYLPFVASFYPDVADVYGKRVLVMVQSDHDDLFNGDAATNMRAQGVYLRTSVLGDINTFEHFRKHSSRMPQF